MCIAVIVFRIARYIVAFHSAVYWTPSRQGTDGGLVNLIIDLVFLQ